MNNSDKDIEIDVLELNETISNPIQLPMNFINIGEVGNEDVKVYIKQDIFEYVEKFSSSDKGKELGGILIGDFVDDLGKVNVVISGYIEAKFTDASSSTLTFTHETWDYVHKEHTRLYPDKKIIGWHHTHPSYGIFLSNYDLFIHQNFFNLPWQIAYVVDPINNTRGFFQWKNGKVQKLEGFYIYDDLQKKIKTLVTSETKNEREETDKTNKWSITIKALIIIILIGLIGLNISLIMKINAVNKTLAITQISNQKLNDKYKGLDDKNNKLSSQISQLEQDVKQTNNANDVNSIALQKYTVQKGDTIASICKNLNIDYSSQIGVIKTINGIKDLNKIYTGQKLLFPK